MASIARKLIFKFKFGDRMLTENIVHKNKMVVTPILYATSISPPCRGVFLALAAAGVDVDIREIRFQYREHRTPEFLKMNPQHTVPTLDDNGFTVCDSHAIVTYLIDEYAKDDSLYPKDLKTRTVINERLHFNNAVLFTNLKKMIVSLFSASKGAAEVSKQTLDIITESYGFLEIFLGNNDWLAGSTYTLADTSIIATVSSLSIWVPIDPVKYPKLAAWAKRCEDQIPGYATANAPGLAILRNIVEGVRSSQ